MSVHKSDIIYLSETYLDSTVPLDNDNLVISGYNLIRSDHPSNTKRGGVPLLQKLFTTKSSKYQLLKTMSELSASDWR